PFGVPGRGAPNGKCAPVVVGTGLPAAEATDEKGLAPGADSLNGEREGKKAIRGVCRGVNERKTNRPSTPPATPCHSPARAKRPEERQARLVIQGAQVGCPAPEWRTCSGLTEDRPGVQLPGCGGRRLRSPAPRAKRRLNPAGSCARAVRAPQVLQGCSRLR